MHRLSIFSDSHVLLPFNGYAACRVCLLITMYYGFVSVMRSS
ncbi:hypothetical protein DVU_3286 [Nitratidesulfovibrio vulgaris str. Hildenborough]|uniref:Uncharacterized protein n=1 Tax=Nitratidesulfovibrio vulgaris (strain ATCC 29579 / DSM 644 / CCUG 34227 / NCIMB 8303 / VKM B-1760 / Hildenborough) TaxID=882 RepID=Q725Y8_NITV2|nr:hypothetical protein DVU_3286 [Nitratidesulfovibrio vulgaris str. Hildenborough]